MKSPGEQKTCIVPFNDTWVTIDFTYDATRHLEAKNSH